MLHTLSHSSSQFDSQAFIEMVIAEDIIILMQDAVTIAINNTTILSALMKKTTHLYVLNVDIEARGLCDYINPNVTIIDYHQFVDLTAQHFPQLAW